MSTLKMVRGFRAALPVAPALFVAAAFCAAPAAGNVVAWGSNESGQLAAGFRSFSSTPVLATQLAGREVREVQSAYFSGYALLADGTVIDWGGNVFKQLGLGYASTPVFTPTLIPHLTAVKQIAQAGAHGMALLEDGQVLTWGGNIEGQACLGIPGEGKESHTVPSPTPVRGLPPIAWIGSGGANDLMLAANGDLYGCGENRTGQLATGDEKERDTPTLIAHGVKAASIGGVPTRGGDLQVLYRNGTVAACGANGNAQSGTGSASQHLLRLTPVPLSGVVQVSAGGDHTLYLTSDRNVWGAGSNSDGELGLRKLRIARRPVTVLGGAAGVAAGLRYSLVLQSGRALGFGQNQVHQAGLPGTANVGTPTDIGLSVVTGIQAGEFGATAITTSGPPPPIEATGGAGQIMLRWRMTAPSNWTVSYKLASATTWTEAARLAPSARSYRLTRLAAGSYEARVQARGTGNMIVTATVTAAAGAPTCACRRSTGTSPTPTSRPRRPRVT